MNSAKIKSPRMAPALFLLLAACAILSGCAGNTPDPVKRQNALAASDLLIVPGQRIGPIHFGMTMDQVSSLLGKPDYEYQVKDGNSVQWFFYDMNLEMTFDHAGGNVTSVDTRRDPAMLTSGDGQVLPLKTVFKTQEGIGLGATAAEVTQAYGTPTGIALPGIMNYNKLGMYCDFVTGSNTTEDTVVEIVVRPASKY